MTALCSVWDPAEHRAVLCVEDAGGGLSVVGSPPGTPSDVADLLADRPSAATLEDAIERSGSVGAQRWQVGDLSASPSDDRPHLRAPVAPLELWAAGVTYQRSRAARMSESADADVYSRVYEARRPELFLKATAARVAGPGADVGLRDDSGWQVPEPELALVIGSEGQVLGFTLGNDMSCRDIEGHNPLYLPQAKIFSGCVSIGPRVLTPSELPDPHALEITVRIRREARAIFEATCATAALRRSFDELIGALRRSNPLPPGVVLLTGTGVVPGDDVTLLPGDVVQVAADPIGTLQNVCRDAATMPPPPGWSRPVPGASG